MLQQRALTHPKINFIWDTVLEEVLGAEDPKAVTGARLKNVKTGKTQDLDVEGVFIAIGHKPSTQIFKGHVDMDESGYILVEPNSTRTNVPGVYAAGDVADKIYRQAVTAAGFGCMAALDAEKFISEYDGNMPTEQPVLSEMADA
jgi:thioredoxin reductase (NADPH)